MTTLLRKLGSSGTQPLNCYRSWEFLSQVRIPAIIGALSDLVWFKQERSVDAKGSSARRALEQIQLLQPKSEPNKKSLEELVGLLEASEAKAA